MCAHCWFVLCEKPMDRVYNNWLKIIWGLRLEANPHIIITLFILCFWNGVFAIWQTACVFGFLTCLLWIIFLNKSGKRLRKKRIDLICKLYWSIRICEYFCAVYQRKKISNWSVCLIFKIFYFFHLELIICFNFDFEWVFA